MSNVPHIWGETGEGYASRVQISQEVHSCDVCRSPEYKQAEGIIKRSGLQPDRWGYLLHDIAAALIGKPLS